MEDLNSEPSKRSISDHGQDVGDNGSRKKQKIDCQSDYVEIENHDQPIYKPRFILEKHPNPTQRKSYGTERRCIVPKPLVVMSNEKDETDPAVVAGLVTVSLVDYRGKEMAKQDDILSCEKGLTQRLEKLRNDSPTVWSYFSLRPKETTEGAMVRLCFEVQYILEDDLSKCLRERLFTRPFEIITKKKGMNNKTSTQSNATTTVRGEGHAIKVTVMPDIPSELSNLLNETMESPVNDIERPFRCTFANCEKAFKRPDHLKNHLVIHTPALQRGFQCKYCRKEFHLKHHVDEHEKIHQREFRCDFGDCTASFDKESQLLTHKKNIHTNIKPYSCDFPSCSQLFDFPSQLRTHQRSHQIKAEPTTLKKIEYCCTENGCKMSFLSNEKLRIHLKSDHQISKEMCQLCGHSFASLSQHLMRGHKMENGIQLFICEEEGCGVALATKASLTFHTRTQHQQSESPSFYKDMENFSESFYEEPIEISSAGSENGEYAV